MNDAFRKLLIGSGYSFLALVVIKFTDLGGSIIKARLLEPKNLGMFAIVKYLLELLGIFTILGIPTAMVKFIAEEKDNTKITKIISSAFITMLIPTITICSIIYCTSQKIAINIYNEPSLTILIRISIITLFGVSLFSFGSSFLQGLQEIKKLASTRIVTSILGIPIVIILIYYAGLKGAIVSMTVSSFIGTGILWWMIRRVWSPVKWDLMLTLDLNFVKKLLNLSFPTFLSGVVMIPILWIVTTRLSLLHGFTQVGMFNVAYVLVQLILFIPTAIGIPLVPKVSEINKTKKVELSKFLFLSLYLTGVVALFLAISFSLFSKFILHILYGTKYLPAWRVLIFLSIAIFLASITYIIGYYLLGVGKMWIGMGFNLIWSICVVIGVYVFLPQYKAEGIGRAYFLAYGIMNVGMLIFIKNKEKIKIKPIVGLVVRGITWGVVSYLVVKFLKGREFLLGSLTILIMFGVGEYFCFPFKERLKKIIMKRIK